MRRLSWVLLFSIVFLFSVKSVAQTATEEEDDGTGVETKVFEEREEVDMEIETSEPIKSTDELPTKAETITPTGESKSEVIFDWNKHQNETNVKHPFAEKGLTRITKQKEYIYKVDESPQKRAASFRVGQFSPLNLSNPEATGPGSTFEDNYDEVTNPMLMFDYEWQLWNSPIGKWGLRAGTGLYIAQGNGHFVTLNQGLTPREILTFWMMPHLIGAVYRLQLWDKQLLVPYAEGGGNVISFGEFRDDGKAPKWGGALGAYFAFGGALNLTYFDNMARIQLDREYGINRVYMTVEYRQVVGLTRFDFSSQLVNAGFLGEF